jgi:hypothetical protein
MERWEEIALTLKTFDLICGGYFPPEQGECGDFTETEAACKRIAKLEEALREIATRPGLFGNEYRDIAAEALGDE